MSCTLLIHTSILIHLNINLPYFESYIFSIIYNCCKIYIIINIKTKYRKKSPFMTKINLFSSLLLSLLLHFFRFIKNYFFHPDNLCFNMCLSNLDFSILLILSILLPYLKLKNNYFICPIFILPIKNFLLS